MIIERVLNRLARELVTRLHLPPSLFGHRYIPSRAPSAYDYELIDEPTVSRVPLPRNVRSRDELPREGARWGFSFWDVVERKVAETYIARIPNCRVLVAADEWGDPHYAILNERNEEMRVRGTGFVRRLHAPLVGAPAAQHLPRATWILEQWDRNYSHWIEWHLVKIALLQKHGRADDIVLPAQHPLKNVIDRSVAALGVGNTHELSSSVLAVDELTVAGIDDYRASLVDDLRNRLTITECGTGSQPVRGCEAAAFGGGRVENPSHITSKLFISRAKAARRHLANEEACWELLAARGYERVFMEDYDFDRQRALIGAASVLAGLHGTGLANMMFAAPGLHVIEIFDPAFPNPQFYALGAALGHHYWLVPGSAVGEFRPGYHDIAADLGALREALDGVTMAR